MARYRLSHANLNRTRERKKLVDGAGLYFMRNVDGSLTPWQRVRLPNGSDQDRKVMPPVMGEVDADWLQQIRALGWSMRGAAAPIDSKITFVEGWELYFGNVKKWSPKTRAHYNNRIRKWLGHSTLFGTPLPKITATLVIEAMAKIRQELPHSAPLVLDDMAKCFAWLKAKELMLSNPAADYQASLRLVEHRPKSDKLPALVELPKLRTLLARLEMSSLDVSLRSALLLQAFTGQRTSEALHARWSEIDLDAATWTIPRKRMKMKSADRPAVHELALHPVMVAMLKKLPRRSDLVFPANGDPDKAIANTQAGRAYQRLGYDGIHVPDAWRTSLTTGAYDATTPEGAPLFHERWVEDVLDHQPPGVQGHYRRDRKTVDGMRRVLMWWGNQLAAAS